MLLPKTLQKRQKRVKVRDLLLTYLFVYVQGLVRWRCIYIGGIWRVWAKLYIFRIPEFCLQYRTYELFPNYQQIFEIKATLVVLNIDLKLILCGDNKSKLLNGVGNIAVMAERNCWLSVNFVKSFIFAMIRNRNLWVVVL